LRLIDQIRPRYFIFENVGNFITAAINHRPISERPGKHWNLKVYETKRFASSDVAPMQPDEMSGSAVRQVFSDISGLGYHLNLGVLDAADYGAPQHRLRFVMIGSRDGDAPFLPTPTHGDSAPRQTPFRTVRDAIYDLRENPGPHSEYGEVMARFFKLVPAGGNWRSLPKELQPEALGPSFEAGGGKCGFFRRLDWGLPAPTVTGRSNRKGSAICHPEGHRPLSVKECARLQGFPDDWVFAGSMSQQYMQIGNAVPVYLGAALGHTILKHKSQVAPVQTEADVELALRRATAKLRGYACNKKSRLKGMPLLAGIDQ
jgi:DNA (cytosine-5)-methyltransferase 1